MKLRFERSNRDGVEKAVRECFATDPDLLSFYHVEAPASLDDCVKRTLADAEKFDVTFRFYLVHVGRELAGYWGTEWDRYLNLIFVKPKFRTREFMEQFWDKIKVSMDGRFATAVYARNKPAVAFYSRHGTKLKEFEMHGQPCISFTFENE